MRMTCLGVVLAVLCGQGAWAQRADQKEVFGAVQGHVTCSDTNQPARLATVTLQPVSEDTGLGGKTEVMTPGLQSQGKAPTGPGLTQYRTRLDGTFVVPRVKPGRYYVVVQKEGYLSPVVMFTRDEVAHPTDEIRDELAKQIPVVLVTPNESVNVEMRLHRGASISGVIRYEDGTPASGMTITLNNKDRHGKWIYTAGTGTRTDDQGRFRIAGLGPAEYRLKTQLDFDRRVVSGIFGGSQMSTGRSGYMLDLYLGGGFREKDAKLLKVSEGEEVNGADITIPLSKLHSVTGSLVSARTGRAINAGTVRLYNVEDDTAVVSAEVDRDDPVFRFEFVPEGTYTARVDNARDVTREPVIPAKGDVFAALMPEFKDITITSYGKYEGPFLVQTDLTAVTIAVPEKVPAPK